MKERTITQYSKDFDPRQEPEEERLNPKMYTRGELRARLAFEFNIMLSGHQRTISLFERPENNKGVSNKLRVSIIDNPQVELLRSFPLEDRVAHSNHLLDRICNAEEIVINKSKRKRKKRSDNKDLFPKTSETPFDSFIDALKGKNPDFFQYRKNNK